MTPHRSSKPRLILLMGPTGAGKTSMALKLALRFGGEIVSADSMQVYRGMDIGTAKPTVLEQAIVHHHLLDVVTPDETFDVSRYCALAREAIVGLTRKGSRIFVVGGTGLYLRALVGGLIQGPGADEGLRQDLKDEIRHLGTTALYERLRTQDPLAAAQIHPRDGIRIVRALEVLTLTGRSIVSYQQAHRFAERPYEVLKIGLMPPKEKLWEAIDARIESMIDRGLVEEVGGLLAKGYEGSLKAMQALGYRHMVAYLAGKVSLPEAVRSLKRDTRRYAKRQLTWFTAEEGISWLDPGDEAGGEALTDRFLASDPNPQGT